MHGVKWKWALLKIHYKRTGFQVDKGVGLLLIDLAVLDLDTLEEVCHWEIEWPVLNDVPMETTSKGKYYFFLRTPLCDELGLTDGPLSITATGTAGAIVFVKLMESCVRLLYFVKLIAKLQNSSTHCVAFWG